MAAAWRMLHPFINAGSKPAQAFIGLHLYQNVSARRRATLPLNSNGSGHIPYTREMSLYGRGLVHLEKHQCPQ